ncbi:MAG: hypothetical protein NZQ09_17050, partial [Chloroflexus sp.]|nr:hypothetical protein [Chloroflexus sp.]
MAGVDTGKAASVVSLARMRAICLPTLACHAWFSRRAGVAREPGCSTRIIAAYGCGMRTAMPGTRSKSVSFVASSVMRSRCITAMMSASLTSGLRNALVYWCYRVVRSMGCGLSRNKSGISVPPSRASF